VKLAGGHDPGPLALPAPEEGDVEAPPDGPWSGDGESRERSDQTFLPEQPPVQLGRAAPEAGPWGRPRPPWGMRRRH
jgi:heat shock protein HtpX